MARLSAQLTLWSRLVFSLWRILRSKKDFTGSLMSGARLRLRPPPSHDLDHAERIFGAELLRPPRPLPEAGRIVDTRAGSGLAVVYWATQHPNAALVAFEAHPDLVESFVDNAELNDLWQRVLLHTKQADTSEGEAQLEGDEGFASIFKKGGAARFRGLKKVDFFTTVGDAPIALLKLRMGGAEQPLLADPRFAGLKVGQLVIEGVTPGARPWCEQRLAELGYQLEPGGAPELIWAAKQT